MSFNEDFDDLEEGEIAENSPFESPFDQSFVLNESSDPKNDISPIFQSLLRQKTDQLFGSSDTDLRVNQNPNVFNDCDERFIANKSLSALNDGFNSTNDQNIPFVGQNIRNMTPITHLRPQLDEPNYRPLVDNRFQYFDSRPKAPFIPKAQPFRATDNQMGVRPRLLTPLPPIRPLLPTPLFTHLPAPPISSGWPEFVPKFQRHPSDLCQSIPQKTTFVTNDRIESKAESFVLPISPSNPVIPFICEPNISQNQTENQNEFQTKGLTVINITSDANLKTIDMSLSDDIQEVQMQVSDADEPYDPEQDVIIISPPISPFKSPSLTPEKSANKKGNTSNDMFVDSNIETQFKDSNSGHKKISVKPEDRAKNERLSRLLKSGNNMDQNKGCKKHRFRGKPQKKESIRMTPKRVPKFIDSMKPISIFAAKEEVYDKCLKKSHKSRRKMKRTAKRRVITESVAENSRDDMREASFEDLVEEYYRIQRQLKELGEEETNKSIVGRNIDKQEEEKIENLFKTQDIPEVSNESKVELNISEDDDENELRRLALESKRRRELKAQEEEAQREDEDEDLLRQQLLMSMKTKTKTNETTAEKVNQSIEENSINKFVFDLKTKANELLFNREIISKTDISEAIPPIPQKPIPKLVIHFGDDSTDDELEQNRALSLRSGPSGLDSFLKQARLRSEPKAHSNQTVPGLSMTKQRELEKLKAEIVRRERIQINDKKLKQNEIQWKSAKERLNEKLSKQNLLKSRVSLKRTALRKAQIQARKLQEAFRAATRLVSATASEFQSFNNELKNIETDVKQEVQNVDKFEKECIRMGLKLYGNTYKLPIPATIKRSNSMSISVSPNKKRLKIEKSVPISRLNIANERKKLVQKLETCKNLLTLKEAKRPSSPQIPQQKTSSEPNVDNSIDTQQVLKCLSQDLLAVTPSDSIISYNCFTEKMFSNKNQKPLNINIRIPESHNNLLVNHKTNCLDDSYDSVLLHLHSYRLIENQSIPISSDLWTNNLNPTQEICKFDLLGTCKDDKCLAQHLGKCLLDPYNKIVDLLLYEPKLGGITSGIPEKMDLELFSAIKQKLLQFSQKLIDSNPKTSLETQCRTIAEQIRKRSNESMVCLLSRRLPKLFDTSRIEVPFDDLMYRFNIKDKNLIINQTMISELKISADPDIGLKNRFYAPEGVPISAQLETSLAADPHNIQLWVKLAYYHISRCSEHNFADSVDNALNVLSRALDHNRSEPELYEHYLFIYSNRVVRRGEDPKFDLFNICRKVVEHCPQYRVRKCVLSLIVDFNDKLKVCAEVINDLMADLQKCKIETECDFETRSHQILEIFFYKMRLYLEQNNIKQSMHEFNSALNESHNENSGDNQSPYISDALTDSDRVFAWICFTYLLIHNSLPNHCFELSNQGFPQLIHKNPFIFDWISLKKRINLNEITEHLRKAIYFCGIKFLDNLSTVLLNRLPIHLNYAELCLVNENDRTYYEFLMKSTENNIDIWPTIVEQLFKTDETHLNAIRIEIFKNKPIYTTEDIRFGYKMAKYYHKNGQSLEAKNQLFTIVSKYFNCLISDTYLIKAFETLVFEDDENNHNFELINNRISKESDSPIIWLSYILLLEIESHSIKDIDSAFQTALALCSVDKTDSKDLQLLWSNYLSFCVQHMTNEKQLMDLFESVRHCCLTITDPTFQSQVIRFFCRLLSVPEKSKALIESAKLIPQNLDIVMTAINFGLRNNKRESVWLLINSLVFDKNIRYKCLQFWKIAIGLSIDRNDHLSVHKFFQISISLMPYNANLWQFFKTYEMSVKHIEHLKQGQNVCENLLKIKHL